MTPKGLPYWLNWIETLKEWVFTTPEGLYTNPSYTVDDVPYADLHALAKHFKQEVAPEGDDHRQWLVVEVLHGMSTTVVWFKSPERLFTYEPLP